MPEPAEIYLFEIPEVDKRVSRFANIAIQVGALASRMVQIERTRCIHPDNRAENVAEHSQMVAMVAPELARELYPQLDQNLVARFGMVHDVIEAYVGDTATDMLAGHSEATKEELETMGLEQLCREYAHMPGFVDIVRRYEKQDEPEARFVRAVDKLMVMLIHFANNGETLRSLYTYESFLQNEAALLKRDAYKYGEFSEIIELRRELGQLLADRFLSNIADSSAE